MNIKKLVAAVVAIALSSMCAISAMADTPTAPGAGSNPIQQERQQVNSDRQQIQADRQKLRADRKSLKQERRERREERHEHHPSTSAMLPTGALPATFTPNS